MAEPAVTRLPADPGIVPTRFAGLQAAQALLPVLCPGQTLRITASISSGLALARCPWGPGQRTGSLLGGQRAE